MTPLRQRMLKDMSIRNLTENTQLTDPSAATLEQCDEVKQYLS
jgi:hypothetical protein